MFSWGRTLEVSFDWALPRPLMGCVREGKNNISYNGALMLFIILCTKIYQFKRSIYKIAVNPQQYPCPDLFTAQTHCFRAWYVVTKALHTLPLVQQLCSANASFSSLVIWGFFLVSMSVLPTAVIATNISYEGDPKLLELSNDSAIKSIKWIRGI